MIYTQNQNIAAIYIVCSGFMFALAGVCIKLATADVSTEEVVFFRNLFGFIVILPFIFREGIKVLPTKIPLWHFSRALAGLSAMYCFFYSIEYIPLSSSMLLSYTTPLFAPFMAYFLLGEKISIKLILIIGIGFIGVIFLLNPSFESFSWVSLIALLSGLLAAMAMTSIRRMSKTEPSIRIVFYYGLICTCISAIPMFNVSELPESNSLLLLFAIGAFATLGQICLTRGYSMSAVAQVGPFMYSTVVFVTIFAWFLWEEVPTLYAGIGIMIVIIAGTFALRQTSHNNRTTS